MMMPVTQDDVRDVAAGFHPDPSRSMSLRSQAYFEQKWLDAELTGVFARTWQWICHAGRLSAPGGYVTATVAGMPVAVVRGREGELRAFYNVCQDRVHGNAAISAIDFCPGVWNSSGPTTPGPTTSPAL